MDKDPLPSPRGTVRLPLWLDNLSVRAAHWPWWAIVIIVGIVISFYSILSSQLYRRALVWVTDDPHITTNQFARVAYDVKAADGSTQRIRGTLIAEDDKTITVETQAEDQVTIPQGDIGKLTCDKPGTDGKCPLNQSVTVDRALISGKLLLEDQGRYQLQTEEGPTVDVRKFTVDNKQTIFTPANCKPDPEGSCIVRLTLKPSEASNQITGLLLDDNAQSITVQDKPALTTTLNKTDVLQTVSSIPAVCALNNLLACNEGIFLTISITVIAFIVSLLIGLVIGLLRVSSNPVLFNVSTVYVEVARGLPMLVILLFAGFAFAPWFRDNFPSAVPRLIEIIILVAVLTGVYLIWSHRTELRTEPASVIQPLVLLVIVAAVLVILSLYLRQNSDLKGVPSAIIGLSFGYGAFLSELFRAGIQSIGKGQMEAGRSLGMTYVQTMRHVILPQAFRVVLPPLGNEFIAMLKDTSLIAILALPELTQRARLFASDTFRTFEPYLTICVLYLVMTLFLSFMVRTVERRMNRSR